VRFTTNAQKATGNIMLHAIPRIQEVIQSMSITDMWTHLETEYSTIGILQVYQEFRKAVTFCIDSQQHPKPQFDAFQGLIDKLGENKIKLDDKLIALILLNSIPCHWEASVLPMVLGIHDVGLLRLLEVKGIITAHYEAEQGRRDKGHTTQKLSAVKRKPTNEPTWQGSAPAPSGSRPPTKGKAPYKKTQWGNRGGKSKQQQKQQCVHLATCASLPASTTTTVAAIGPSGVNVCTVKAPAPVTSGSGGRHESFNDAMSLADCMGVEKTPCIVKTLEE
jgi:gag-polypeptide of LTR copia-type